MNNTENGIRVSLKKIRSLSPIQKRINGKYGNTKDSLKIDS